MKLLAFSDIHGAYKRVDDILSHEPGYDAILIVGDLTTRGSATEATQALQLFARHGKPIISVTGNMDPPALEKVFKACTTYGSGKGSIIGDVGIAGVSGSPPTPFATPFEMTEEEIAHMAEQGWREIASARWKIFMPHAPPHKTKADRTIMGTHVGSTAVRAFIEQHQPHVAVCGHIHEARSIDRIGTTTVVNCGPAGKGYYVVITADEKISVELRG